jgi:RNA polymerase sigma-70 factor (ECF subfamily)
MYPHPTIMTSQATALFEEHRQLLFSIAYRMLGTVMDAQDMVQDTFIRWHESTECIQSPRAWLTTVLTRLCINHLGSARVKRETYVGSWLPEPLVEARDGQPEEAAELADSLSLAFLVLLETLTPTERAVFILREVLGHEFSEVAAIVGKEEANCRQILTRARKHVHERRPRFDASPAQAEELMQRFLQAVTNGELENLIDLLAEDVVFVSDGGGKAKAFLKPVHGAEAIARPMINATRKFRTETQEIKHAMINGLPGFVTFEGTRAVRVMAFGILGGRIQSIFVISNPDKLGHLVRPS